MQLSEMLAQGQFASDILTANGNDGKNGRIEYFSASKFI